MKGIKVTLIRLVKFVVSFVAMLMMSRDCPTPKYFFVREELHNILKKHLQMLEMMLYCGTHLKMTMWARSVSKT